MIDINASECSAARHCCTAAIMVTLHGTKKKFVILEYIYTKTASLQRRLIVTFFLKVHFQQLSV